MKPMDLINRFIIPKDREYITKVKGVSEQFDKL